jgi:hypothetical protein
MGWSGRGRAELAAAVGPLPVVVPGILGQGQPQMSFAENQHPVSHLRPGGQYKPLGVSVRPWTPGRDLHRLDAGAGQGRIE